MKRWIGLVLVSVLLASLALPGSLALAEEAALPQVGESLHGFTVKSLGTERLIEAPSVYMTHDKTGAELLYILADDPDCSFDISFRTPALNSKGIPHVFEHITISGSDKYPAQNLFFPLISQTYNTFVNAMTYPNMTTYPLSSLSEKQLLKLSDYYLDGLFHPLIYKDERFAKREAWRYVLTDKDQPLTLTGTVYNEMRGNDTIESAAHYNLLSLLYPDSILSNVNGGDPDHIPEMTWQELVDFHKEYYHPSNSLTVLYGKMDIEPFLAQLDGYFSEFEAKEFHVPTGEGPVVPGYTDKAFAFPVEASSPAENGAIVQYGMVADGLSQIDIMGFNIITSVLTHESSPLTAAVRQALPKATLSGYIDPSVPDPYILFQLSGANAEDMETFKSVLDEQLPKFAEAGLDREILEAVIANEEFSNLLIPEVPNLGVNFSVAMAIDWAGIYSLSAMNDRLAALEYIKKQAPENYFQNLIQTYLLNNPCSVLTATYPVPGLAEEEAALRAEALAQVKAAMTDEEIAALIEENKALDAWSKEDAPKELVDTLKAVSADTLPEEIQRYEITEARREAYRTLVAPAATAGVGATNLLLDASAIPQELLHAYRLYTSLMGQMDTKNYGRAELQTLITRYLNGFSADATALFFADGTYLPALSTNFKTLNADYEKALELAREVVFHTNPDDLAMLASLIAQEKFMARYQLNNAPYTAQMSRIYGSAYADHAYNDYLTGLAYMDYLAEAEAMLQEDPTKLIAQLDAVQGILSNRQNATILFAGNEEGISGFDAYIDTLFEGIPAAPIEKAAYAFEAPAKREALVVDSTVQYNLTFAPLSQLGLEYTGKLIPLNQLIFDAYLTPEIRHGIGAYGIINIMDKRGILFCSYRDPAVAETFAVYEALAEFVKTAPVTQETLDGYIISTYSSFVVPQGALTGASRAMANRVLGWPDDENLIRMREIKSATVEDLRALSTAMEKLAAEGFRSTSGSASVVGQHKDLFDRVIQTEKK